MCFESACTASRTGALSRIFRSEQICVNNIRWLRNEVELFIPPITALDIDWSEPEPAGCPMMPADQKQLVGTFQFWNIYVGSGK
jgi:hypothetical protein